ncbi:uncharacterized protein B0I36DRAFT_333228 [Microdochium trichocladiopsis]|uniref:Uncharacterized protein n=1 Tax=Microdochium trichocladiopsis TaxID=1682393 RepID=A0A9P8XXG8_9PEZI|nr:uncharacterized protein B0I36DRAFT_333228 [Microdochium trichocladiopsis]KAH7020820.1 hypothetical protein B0I36DRAFT_333228 [Microdochium trichocladiopsis]
MSILRKSAGLPFSSIPFSTAVSAAIFLFANNHSEKFFAYASLRMSKICLRTGPTCAMAPGSFENMRFIRSNSSSTVRALPTILFSVYQMVLKPAFRIASATFCAVGLLGVGTTELGGVFNTYLKNWSRLAGFCLLILSPIFAGLARCPTKETPSSSGWVRGLQLTSSAIMMTRMAKLNLILPSPG